MFGYTAGSRRRGPVNLGVSRVDSAYAGGYGSDSALLCAFILTFLPGLTESWTKLIITAVNGWR